MALMSFREPNLVNWVGVRPGHRGTQIKSIGEATAGATLMYTVPAGKTFALTYFELMISAQATGFVTLIIRDAGGVGWLTLARHYVIVATPYNGQGTALSFPVELPAAYDFVVMSSAAGLTADAVIVGWVE